MKRTALGILLGVAVAALLGTAWNGSYEASPAGNDLASDLDTFIKGFKTEVRQRAEVEHIWGGSGDDNGLHTMGSARCFVQNTAPTDINSGTGALGQYNSAASSDGLTTLSADEIGPVTRDIGAGRCWIDLDGLDNTAGTIDDRQLNVWDETANAFVPVTAQAPTASAGLAFNQIYNGSFEITDGTGLVASTTVPAGWADLDTPTIGYTDPTGPTEGEGIALRTTANGGPLEGVRQTLNSLHGATTYVFRARVRATAGDTCTLGVSDGITTVSDVSVANGIFETLEVSLTTTGGAAAVDVDLTSTLNGDICEWDHVTAFPQAPLVAQPGIVICRDTDASTAAAYATPGNWEDALVSCAVTPPGPGYLLEVRGQLVANHLSGNTGVLAARLRENGTTRSISVAAAADHNNGLNTFRDLVAVPFFYSALNPTPGTTLTFTVEGSPSEDGGASNWERNLGVSDGPDDLPDAFGILTTLEVKLTPTR